MYVLWQKFWGSLHTHTGTHAYIYLHTYSHTLINTGNCVRVSILTAKGFKLSARSWHILLLPLLVMWLLPLLLMLLLLLLLVLLLLLLRLINILLFCPCRGIDNSFCYHPNTQA